MPHVIANFTLEAKGLFFSCFCEFSLKWILLSAVSLLFSFMVTFTFCQGSTFSSLVKSYTVNLMSLTIRTVGLNFLRNVHVFHYRLCIRETNAFLYLFTYILETLSLEPSNSANSSFLLLEGIKTHAFLNCSHS